MKKVSLLPRIRIDKSKILINGLNNVNLYYNNVDVIKKDSNPFKRRKI